MPSLSAFCAIPGSAAPGRMTPGLLAYAGLTSGALPQITFVTESVTQIFTVNGVPFPWNLIVANGGPATIYAGGISVSPAAGFVVPPGGRLLLTGLAGNVWAVTASGSATVTAWLASLLSAV